MLSSRLFWRIFIAYAALSIVSALLYVKIQSSSLDEVVISKQLEYRLRDSAIMLKSQMESGLLEEPTEDVKQELSKKLQLLAEESQTRLTLIVEKAGEQTGQFEGIVIGDSDEDPAKMDDHGMRPEIVAARNSDSGIGTADRFSDTVQKHMKYYALRVEHDGKTAGYVRVSMPRTAVEEAVASVERIIWRTAGVITLVALVLTYLIVGRITKPLETLTHAADSIAAGDLRQNVDISGTDEVATLGKAFNTMSTQLAERMDELRYDSRLRETVLGTMIEGVIAVDRDQNVLFANEAAAPLLDVESPDIVGRPVWEAARNATIQETVQRTLDQQTQQNVEFEIARTQTVVSMVATPLPGTPCPGAVLVMEDVTELRRLENMRRDFVSNVSHELKTPLTSIQAYAETLLSGAMEEPDIRQKFVGRIDEQASRLHSLILDLLSLARIESGPGVYDVVRVSVAETANRSVAEYTTVADKKGLSLGIDSSPDDTAVMADADELREIFDNLIDNAIKHTPSEGAVKVRWNVEDSMCRIEVEDTGMGIPEDQQTRIFERFYRVDKARSRELGGTGLGLSIVKNLAQVFDGSVEVTSTLGEGSTFTVKLPLAPST